MNTLYIGKRIMNLRKGRGYTQEKLAELLQISPQAVSKWENGHALPETALLPGLAKALDTSIDFILTDNQLQILAAFYGDGLENCEVTDRLNQLVQHDCLELEVGASSLACPLDYNRPRYLIVSYQTPVGVFYAFAQEGNTLQLGLDSRDYQQSDEVQIIAACYGTAKSKSDVMHKMEHYRVFNWSEYAANHETFPSSPNNDEREHLTFVYLCKDGIRLVSCAEGESIAYLADRSAMVRKQNSGEHLIPRVPLLPEFGKGWDCSWAAALTAALQAMDVQTDYEHVMGVSGACYRLAFCSPEWDYSSVDGLVAYDYATPGYRAFGFTPKFAGRVDKGERAQERKYMLEQIRHNMPVLGINLRVAAEWGVICGYRENGEELLCRSKYDAHVLESPGFESGKSNAYNYLPVENWPFIITYFDNKVIPPTDKENLLQSLRIFIDGAKQLSARGCAMGLYAYEVWMRDLLDEKWYRRHNDERFARRFSVNQFCSLALLDARKAALSYLSENKSLLPEKSKEMEQIVSLFQEISEKAKEIHKLLDSGEYLEGKRARRFWTKEMREQQATLLGQMQAAEERALMLAQQLCAAML